MRLVELFRPRTLSDVIGQPPVHFLKRLARSPQSCCILLDGPPGCGKTASAFAMAHDLGCYDIDTWPKENAPTGSIGNCTGLFSVIGSDLSVDYARELFGQTLRFRYGSSSGFNVLVIEEFEWVSKQCQVFLKTTLETRLHKNLIVIGTTNDATGLGKALLQRFKTYHFSGGPSFHKDAVERLYAYWLKLAPGQAAPRSLREWGVDADGNFSMRVALDELSDHLSVLEVV